MAQAREEAGDSRLVSAREPLSPIIRVSVKTPQGCQEFLLSKNCSVHHLKKQISKHLHCDTDRLVLIFTGKILRDQDILCQRGIHDGTTVHLVVRTHLKGPPPSPGALPGPTESGNQHPEVPTSEGTCMLSRLRRLVRSSPDLADFFCQLAQLLMSTPETVVQFLEDSLVQGMASEKPNNASHVPESSRPGQKAELALKVPETVQSTARHQDIQQTDKRGLDKSLKAVPSGDNVMRPICSDVQQLMLTTLAPMVPSKGHSVGPEAGRGECNAYRSVETATTIPTAVTPTRIFLPEVSAGAGTQPKGMASKQANAGCKNGVLFSNSGQDAPSQDSQQSKGKVPGTCQRRPSPSALRRALHVLQQNPSLLHQLATGSPLRHHIPLLPILTNPRALQALIQIEKGLQVLSKEVPELGPYLWAPGRPERAKGTRETRQDRGTDSVQPALAVLQLLHALANACSPSTQQPSPPFLAEGCYQQELEHLKAMGFDNHDANLQALKATSGDIHAAIERLLGALEA
ncbi:ubiquilin-1-like [Erinaceus europaeus]|uniref:Ubiquilin-1-like n=1 Tax=Erinaceus europaeus TaxID=9365 RepID=A0A1S3ADX2_ERIEU|nr:ubiquilin-1-like [Erinaceus europaeus]